MTTDYPFSGDFDRERFKSDLVALIDRACESGIDIRGAYDRRSSESDRPDYTIEVYELDKALLSH